MRYRHSTLKNLLKSIAFQRLKINTIRDALLNHHLAKTARNTIMRCHLAIFHHSITNDHRISLNNIASTLIRRINTNTATIHLDATFATILVILLRIARETSDRVNSNITK